MLPDFKNEPIIDFSCPEDKNAMEAAIAKVNSELGKEYPLIIGGEKITTDDKITSINPAKTDEVIGVFSKCDRKLADKALQAALDAYESWSRVHPRERARYLLGAAQKMRERRFEFCAWMVVEESKSWIEAYGDTAEAIDFLEFYAREMMRLANPQPLTPFNGFETNLYYIPLGVGAVIPPWNFPNAIMTGMTSASIVTGNTVLLKPASTAPAIAYKFVEIMEDLMLPPGVLNFIPGSGAEIGDYIVDHPKTRFIAFTGSMEIGLRIVERAAKTSEGQIWIKRVIAEMGGKDFVLADETVDTDMVAQAIVTSAFGFQGQKCSAGSRAIIVESVYDEIAGKVVEFTKKLKMGDPRDFANYNGAVIDKGAYDKILSYIDIGKEEGELLVGGKAGPKEGYFIENTVFGRVDGNARIAQEEIFGPVVALIPVKDFDQGIEVANSTLFGLTGAVISRDRSRLEHARWHAHVGNLYFNRKCTGALVGAEPFGGFNMSGTDSKAGGRDYLLLLTQAKLVSELY